VGRDLVYESFDASGEKKVREKITGQRRGRVNVMGGMREYMISAVFFIKKGDGDIFYELQQLNDFVKKGG